MATHSSVLAWRIPGTGEPGGLPSMGSHRVGHNWSNLAAAAASVTKDYTLDGLQTQKCIRVVTPYPQGHVLRSTVDAWNWIVPNPIYTIFFPIHTYQWKSLIYKLGTVRAIPSGPALRISPSNTAGAGSIPGWAAKVPHAWWPKNQNRKQKQYCNKLNKNSENGPHQKNLLKKLGTVKD